MAQVRATLKTGRDKPVRTGHPWIFSGAVAAWSASPAPGDTVDVVASDGAWLARGLASPHGNLAIRLYAWRENERLDADFFASALAAAIDRRTRVVQPTEPATDSFRLCFSESDGLSGLIVDQYAGVASVQWNTSLLLPYRDALESVLRTHGLTSVHQYDEESFAREGATAPTAAPADSPPVRIRESGFTYEVDVTGGQKTGFYLDQRVNRRRVAAYARGRRCLSAYCYTGGFETHLAHAGATTIAGLDRSAPALERAAANQALNPGGTPAQYEVADVPVQLRMYRDRATTFDLIILDPPKFVHHQSQMEKGLRAYKDINRLAMKLLTPGGVLATFSCSGWVKHQDFLTALEWAARDAGRTVRQFEQLGQPPDHPILLGFPESDYLCGYVLLVE